MKERNNIAPKLRPGEQLPNLPEGFVAIRVDGKIIGVSAAQSHDVFYGKSGYTKRQLRQIDLYRYNKREQVMAVTEAEEELKNHLRRREYQKKQVVWEAEHLLRENFYEVLNPQQWKTNVYNKEENDQ